MRPATGRVAHSVGAVEDVAELALDLGARIRRWSGLVGHS
jgi:hypothetical protein